MLTEKKVPSACRQEKREPAGRWIAASLTATRGELAVSARCRQRRKFTRSRPEGERAVLSKRRDGRCREAMAPREKARVAVVEERVVAHAIGC